MNPARRVTVGLCIREGVDGALVVCQGCWRRRWLFWWQMGVGGADDVDVLPWRVRLRCQRCAGTWFHIKPMPQPERRDGVSDGSTDR